jgi:Domain of unknown function (DUF4253)
MEFEIQQISKPRRLSDTARQRFAEAKRAGFSRLGWLSIAAQLPLRLACFANDDSDIALIVVGRADEISFEPLYFDLFSDLVGPKKLTTSTSAFATSIVDWGIYKYAYDNASIDDVLAKHCWHLARLKSKPATVFMSLADVEKSILESIEYEKQAIAEMLTRKVSSASRGKLRSKPDRHAASPDDPFGAIRAAGTDGVNYDLLTEDIVARLKQWQSLCEFRVIAAQRDAVEIEFVTLPKDMNAFARELYDFCPDLVEQGTEGVAGTLELMKTAGRKPSKAMQKLIKGVDFDDKDFGIEILKRMVQQTKNVRLWWD